MGNFGFRVALMRLGSDFPCVSTHHFPEGPSTQSLGTWVSGNSNSSTGFGQVYDY